MTTYHAYCFFFRLRMQWKSGLISNLTQQTMEIVNSVLWLTIVTATQRRSNWPARSSAVKNVTAHKGTPTYLRQWYKSSNFLNTNVDSYSRECLAMEHLGIISLFKLHVNCTMYIFLSFHHILISDHSYYLPVVHTLANLALCCHIEEGKGDHYMSVWHLYTVPYSVDVALSKCQ